MGNFDFTKFSTEMPFADLQTSLLRCHLQKGDFIILLFETFPERRRTMKDFEVLMTFVNSDQSSWGRDPCLLFDYRLSGDGQTARIESAIC